MCYDTDVTLALAMAGRSAAWFSQDANRFCSNPDITATRLNDTMRGVPACQAAFSSGPKLAKQTSHPPNKTSLIIPVQ